MREVVNMAGTFIYLRIEGDAIDFQELDKHLKLKPQLIQKKGEKFQIKRNKSKQLNKAGVYKTDCWQYEMEAEEGMNMEALLDQFLDALEEDRPVLQCLSECYDIKLYISAYPESRHYSFDFSKEQLQRIGSYRIPLAFSALYLGE